MLVSNTLLIKIYVNGFMFCFMSDMLYWFANGEHQHLKIELNNIKKTNLKITTTFFEDIIFLVPTVRTQLNQHTHLPIE